MRIVKRISFSLGGVWTEWGFRWHAIRRINVVFPGVVNFPWFQQWNALLSESARACQHNFDSFPATAHSTRGSDVVRPLHSAMRQRARAAVRSRSGPIAHQLSPIAKIFALANSYGLGGGVGRGLGDSAVSA